jgi:hypothetical protein
MPVERYWYVVIDDTPINPERPLSAHQATERFLTFVVADNPDQTVEIQQCDDELLEWAFGEEERS